MLIDIALDAVGTDKAPEAEIRGSILACRNLPVRVHLVGPKTELHDLLDEHLDNEDLPIVIHHASERIGMEEKAAHAVRTKKDSSMRVGLKLVREGHAAGFVTAGNTGAAMATPTAIPVRTSMSRLDNCARFIFVLPDIFLVSITMSIG